MSAAFGTALAVQESAPIESDGRIGFDTIARTHRFSESWTTGLSRLVIVLDEGTTLRCDLKLCCKGGDSHPLIDHAAVGVRFSPGPRTLRSLQFQIPSVSPIKA